MTLSDAIKRAILESPLSIYQIAKATGVAQAVLSRFMADGAASRDIRLRTADKLAAYFGLSLEPVIKPAKTSKAPPAFTPPKKKPRHK